MGVTRCACPVCGTPDGWTKNAQGNYTFAQDGKRWTVYQLPKGGWTYVGAGSPPVYPTASEAIQRCTWRIEEQQALLAEQAQLQAEVHRLKAEVHRLETALQGRDDWRY